MNAIIGFTTIAVSHIDNKDQVRDCLQKVLSSSNHLLSLINDILDMSRIESGKVQINEQECNISELMHNLVNIIQLCLHQRILKRLRLFPLLAYLIRNLLCHHHGNNIARGIILCHHKGLADTERFFPGNHNPVIYLNFCFPLGKTIPEILYISHFPVRFDGLFQNMLP